MTDLEMTRLCAEAMGFKLVYPDENSLPFAIESDLGSGLYDPLNDDVQAMALVKKFELDILIAAEGGRWLVGSWVGGHDIAGADDPDLNHAIVECVAKMTARTLATTK